MLYLPAVFSDNIVFLLLVLVLSVAIMWKGANWLVDSASAIALKLSVSPLVVGLTIVAIGTSAPEFVVSLQAALQGKPEIAVGNVFGSNIFNLGFILGIGALFGSIRTDKKTVYQTGGFLIFSAAAVYFFSFGLPSSLSAGYLSPVFCIVMIAMLALYVFFLYWKKDPQELPAESEEQKNSWSNDCFFLILGLVFTILGGRFLVDSGILLGVKAGLSDWIIGITIVAAGTSCPELVTTLAAIAKRKQSVAIGNLLGSDLFNILGVIGLAGIVSGGIALAPITNFSLLILCCHLFIVVFFLRTSWSLSRLEGFLLIGISIFRYVLDFQYLQNF
jgi:cation:H+ antiporter